jgi:uncharacterized Zn finger protein (UPF0148 family)
MATGTKKPVVEEVKNCPACKKPLKKSRRFYRNGSYYCNSNCFKKADVDIQAAKAKAVEAKAAAKAAAAATPTAEEAKG